MKTEKPVKDLLAAWEAHDPTKMASLLADDFKLTGAAPQPLNREAFLMFQRVHNEAFADWKFTVIELDAIGNKVDVIYYIKATHTGIYDLSHLDMVMRPIPPSGKSLRWSIEHMTCTVKNDQISQIEVETAQDDWVTGIIEWLEAKPPAMVR
jgi:predicted ester cyclase